jgi:hypothetical protein
MHLPNPVIRSHYANGFIKQYVRNHLILRTEAATNNVNYYGVKKAVENPVRFEVKAEIEYRIPKHSLFAEHERDKETAEAAVAVQERRDRLKLNMHKSCFD